MNRRNYIILALLAAVVVAFIVVDCQRNPHRNPAPTTTLRGKALGTFYQITIKGTPSPSFEARLDSLFGAANRSMSIFDPSSLLSRINRGETDQADPYIAHCIDLAQRVSALSDGAYDITIRPLVEAYGFAGKEAAKAPNVDSLLEFVGYE
ncbi:MAG: FAD:protein FMN transferase, partial [Tidjanibacter sp.]|nr:FAD:protein FMN transferase [Tidjanibacter sp.]